MTMYNVYELLFMYDLTLNDHVLAGLGSAYGCQASAVFITQGQVEQDVPQVVQANADEFVGECRAHTLKRVDGSGFQGFSHNV